MSDFDIDSHDSWWPGIIFLIIFALVIGYALSRPADPPIPCNRYADSRLTNVPARCIKEFTK